MKVGSLNIAPFDCGGFGFHADDNFIYVDGMGAVVRIAFSIVSMGHRISDKVISFMMLAKKYFCLVGSVGVHMREFDMAVCTTLSGSRWMRAQKAVLFCLNIRRECDDKTQ